MCVLTLAAGKTYNTLMITIFLGLTNANLILLSLVFGLGFAVDVDARTVNHWYVYHIVLAIAAGLLATLTHVGTYIYFMATSKWLHAAAEGNGLDLPTMVQPAYANKSRAFAYVMLAVAATALAMFAGAGTDATVQPWWPAGAHLTCGVLAILANALAAAGEYRLIVDQGRMMDRVLAIIHRPESPPAASE